MTDAYLIDEIYKERILENQRILDKRVNDTYDKYPLLKELDDEISSKIIADTLKKIGASAASSDGASLEELKAKRLSYLKEIGIDDNYLTSYYHCDKCRDTGYLEDGTLCTCFIKLKAELMIKRSPIRDRIGKDTFSNFSFDYYSDKANDNGISPKDAAKAAYDEAVSFVKGYPSNENMLITGPTGVGKTYLTTAIVSELIKDAHMVCYLPAADLFEIMGDHTFNRPSSGDISYKDVVNSKVLIIDDLGTELNSGFVDSTLFSLINNRLNQGLSTIISTNLGINQIGENYSSRIASRIFENYKVIKLFGNDIRLVKRNF